MRSALVIVVMLIGAGPAFADQSAVPPPSSIRFGALRSQKPKDPYKPFFDARQALKNAQQQAAHDQKEDLKPKVVCGMMIIPADPDLDPKMRVTPPQDPKLEYKIRVLEPPKCR